MGFVRYLTFYSSDDILVKTMIGAIAGDIIGSAYEFDSVKSTDFKLFTPESRFTDDTVLTVAVADCILNSKDYTVTLKKYGRHYPDAGYGSMFADWLDNDYCRPYNSYGNGSAMRVSPIGFAYSTIWSVMDESRKSAEATHNPRYIINKVREILNEELLHIVDQFTERYCRL